MSNNISWNSLKMLLKWYIVGMSIKTCSGAPSRGAMSLARVREWLLPSRKVPGIKSPYIKKAHASFLQMQHVHCPYAHSKGSKVKSSLLSWNAQAVIFPCLSVCAPALECSEE